jgi:hypothetical protein
MFLLSGTSQTSNRPYLFVTPFFLGNRRIGEEVNGECHEREKMPHNVAKNLAYVVGPISRLMGPNVANFSSTDSS